MTKAIEELAVELNSCADFTALQNAFISFFLNEGVKMMSYHHLPPPGAADYSPSIAVAAHGFPEDWVTLMLRSDFMKSTRFQNAPFLPHTPSGGRLCGGHRVYRLWRLTI